MVGDAAAVDDDDDDDDCDKGKLRRRCVVPGGEGCERERRVRRRGWRPTFSAHGRHHCRKCAVCGAVGEARSGCERDGRARRDHLDTGARPVVT